MSELIQERTRFAQIQFSIRCVTWNQRRTVERKTSDQESGGGAVIEKEILRTSTIEAVRSLDCQKNWWLVTKEETALWMETRLNVLITKSRNSYPWTWTDTRAVDGLITSLGIQSNPSPEKVRSIWFLTMTNIWFQVRLLPFFCLDWIDGRDLLSLFFKENIIRDISSEISYTTITVLRYICSIILLFAKTKLIPCRSDAHLGVGIICVRACHPLMERRVWASREVSRVFHHTDILLPIEEFL